MKIKNKISKHFSKVARAGTKETEPLLARVDFFERRGIGLEREENEYAVDPSQQPNDPVIIPKYVLSGLVGKG